MQGIIVHRLQHHMTAFSLKEKNFPTILKFLKAMYGILNCRNDLLDIQFLISFLKEIKMVNDLTSGQPQYPFQRLDPFLTVEYTSVFEWWTSIHPQPPTNKDFEDIQEDFLDAIFHLVHMELIVNHIDVIENPLTSAPFVEDLEKAKTEVNKLGMRYNSYFP